MTNRCNSRCQTCIRTFELLEPLRHLTLAELQAIVDQFPGLERVVLHGIGEPLLVAELPAMIRAGAGHVVNIASAAGFVSAPGMAAYNASKAAADMAVRAYFETFGLPVTISNCSNNYGPYQYPEKLIPVVILNALAGKPLPIYGTGGNVRDWLFVEDHCRAIWHVLQHGKPGEMFISMAKEGSVVSGLMDSFATSVSIMLQYGVPLKVLINKFCHARFKRRDLIGLRVARGAQRKDREADPGRKHDQAGQQKAR